MAWKICIAQKEDTLEQQIIKHIAAMAARYGTSLRTGLGELGTYGREVDFIAGQCDLIATRLKEDPDMDARILEDHLKEISAHIYKAMQTLKESHALTHRKMTSIGNKKRINKAYNDLKVNEKLSY